MFNNGSVAERLTAATEKRKKIRIGFPKGIPLREKRFFVWKKPTESGPAEYGRSKTASETCATDSMIAPALNDFSQSRVVINAAHVLGSDGNDCFFFFFRKFVFHVKTFNDYFFTNGKSKRVRRRRRRPTSSDRAVDL